MSSDTGMPCLDIVAGPGGAMYGTDLKNGNVIRVMHPKNGEGAMDVFPLEGYRRSALLFVRKRVLIER